MMESWMRLKRIKTKDRKSLWVFLTIMFCFPIARSQNTSWSLTDSIRLSWENEPTISAGLDSRHSYLRGKSINIFGLRVGADFKKTAAFVGLYTTAFQSVSNDNYEYVYLSGIGEYRWFKNYRWFITQTLQLGVGNASLTFVKPDGTKDFQDLMIIPVETGVNTTYRVWKYVGLSAGVGARFSLTPGSYFSSSYYTFGVALHTDEISKTLSRLKRKKN